MNVLPALCLSALLFGACKKDAKLPEPTSSGANTLGCRIDGQAFASRGKSTAINSRGISSVFISKGPWPRVSIIASQEEPRYQIAVAFNFRDTPGRYELTATYPYQGKFTDLSGGSTAIDGTNEFKTKGEYVGHVTVTYYSGAIISGRFEFDAVNDANKLVQVRDGRFDLSLSE